MSESEPCRVRLAFRKGEPLKYISHLDLLRAWERMLRRAGLPVAYSQGFNPHMKVTIAMPLPVGCTGEREIADVIMEERLAPEEILAALVPACPEGMAIIDAREVPLQGPAMPNLIRQATYRLTLSGISEQEARQHVAALLEQKEAQVEFRKQSFDLRPLVHSIAVEAMPPLDAAATGAAREGDGTRGGAGTPSLGHGGLSVAAAGGSSPCPGENAVILDAVLLRDERGRIGRPDVLLETLGLSEHAVGMCRTAILLDEPRP
jgi:radical SAM-linked protein